MMTATSAAAPAVHIFWDNSNIFIPAEYVATRRERGYFDRSIRIQFDRLYSLARAGRQVAAAVCVGSVPPELETVWDRLEDAGVEVELYERGGKSGREQGVDQCLQVHMLHALVDAVEPGTAVLLTGDGAGYEDGVGFHADLERMARKGWGVEVIAWDICCNRRLKAWAQEHGVYIPLEDYYDTVTFIQGGRRSRPLSLTHRAVAIPQHRRQHQIASRPETRGAAENSCRAARAPVVTSSDSSRALGSNGR